MAKDVLFAIPALLLIHVSYQLFNDFEAIQYWEVAFIIAMLVLYKRET